LSIIHGLQGNSTLPRDNGLCLGANGVGAPRRAVWPHAEGEELRALRAVDGEHAAVELHRHLFHLLRGGFEVARRLLCSGAQGELPGLGGPHVAQRPLQRPQERPELRLARNECLQGSGEVVSGLDLVSVRELGHDISPVLVREMMPQDLRDCKENIEEALQRRHRAGRLTPGPRGCAALDIASFTPGHLSGALAS
jgi:hypothetical protein